MHCVDLTYFISVHKGIFNKYEEKKITLIGGSGFLAKYCISALLQEGHKLKIICRNPHLAGYLRTMAPIDQLDIVKGNVMLKHTIEPHIKNTDVIINFIGVLNDSSGGQSFKNCHAIGPQNIADLCKKFKVKKFIHFLQLALILKVNLSINIQRVWEKKTY